MAESTETHTEEEQERIDAVNRRQRGERPSEICKSLGRSRSWLQKWVGGYNNPISFGKERVIGLSAVLYGYYNINTSTEVDYRKDVSSAERLPLSKCSRFHHQDTSSIGYFNPICPHEIAKSQFKGLNESCHDPWSELCDVLGFMRKP